MFHANYKPFRATFCLSLYDFEIYAIVQAGAGNIPPEPRFNSNDVVM
jgi:hypothetical protein